MINWPDFKFPPINLLNFPLQHSDYVERDGIVQQMRELCAERYALTEEMKRTQVHHYLVGTALNHYEKQLRMLDFLHFCRTGSYPK